MAPSFLLRSTARRVLTSAPRVSIAPARSFQSFRALNAGKESALHNENRAEEAEAAKQEQLRKAREGKGEWHEELSSDSESIIKAEKGETGKSTEEHIKELQKEAEKVNSKK